MARKCFMCGSEVTEGILCGKCDKPRRKSTPDLAAQTAVQASSPAPAQSEAPPPAVSHSAPVVPPSTHAPASAPVLAAQPAVRASPPAPAKSEAPPPAVSHSAPVVHHSNEATAPALAPDPFPKAPILPFPVESATPAITSVVNLLVASGVASVLVG